MDLRGVAGVLRTGHAIYWPYWANTASNARIAISFLRCWSELVDDELILAVVVKAALTEFLVIMFPVSVGLGEPSGRDRLSAKIVTGAGVIMSVPSIRAMV